MSVIERSALQKLCQRYGSDETQQCPGKSDVEIKVLSGRKAKDSTKTYYDYT
jgi:hypothetical protein